MSLGLVPILGDPLQGRQIIAFKADGRVDSLVPGQSGSSWTGTAEATRETRHSFGARVQPVPHCGSLFLSLRGGEYHFTIPGET